MNQTLLRSILKIGGGYFLAKGVADESTMEAIISGLVALIGVIWGVVHRSDGKIANPLPLLTLGLGLWTLGLSGCASTPKPTEDQVERISRAATVAEIAAYTGAGFWLLEHPGDRDKVTLAISALDGLSSTNGYSGLALAQALSILPIKELKGEKGSLLVGAAVLLYETELSRLTPIEQGPYVAIMTGRIRAGLQRALDQTKPNP